MTFVGSGVKIIPLDPPHVGDTVISAFRSMEGFRVSATPRDITTGNKSMGHRNTHFAHNVFSCIRPQDAGVWVKAYWRPSTVAQPANHFQFSFPSDAFSDPGTPELITRKGDPIKFTFAI